jgi:ParB/RepB/Spo0J family partition protein
MATTTQPSRTAARVRMIALEETRTDCNVRRRLAGEEVDQLAQSIALLGQLTPVSVRPCPEGGYQLIAGHKRHAALTQLANTTIRAEIREDDGSEASERAAENIVRSQLDPRQEAVAVQAMFDSGLSSDGVAQALGWSKSRVTARIKLLELPERAQRMIGEGTLPLASIEPLRAIGAVSAEILDVVVNHVHGGGWGASRLSTNPATCSPRRCGSATRSVPT